MTVLISCQNISKSFGHRTLFEHLSFGLNSGECTGLIGPNGSGKSTLLKMMAGLESPDEGALTLRKNLRTAYLPQTEDLSGLGSSVTVGDFIRQGLASSDLPEYEISTLCAIALHRAGFADPGQAVLNLSGGWRKRLSILARIVRDPELLLLDEPTNHMDLEGVLWLEKFLSTPSFSFLVVTHDRRFLERVSNRTIELNSRYPGGHFSTPGNYSRFLEKREEQFDSQLSREASLGSVVRREIAWLRQGAKARTTKARARIDRADAVFAEFEELKDRNSRTRTVDIDFSGSRRSSRRLVELGQVAKTLGGRKLFGPLDLLIGPGDKLGLLGENGSGKSTLLKILAGELAPDSGTRRQAEQLKVVYFDQQREQLDLSLSLKQSLCPSGDQVIYRDRPIHVAGWARRFLFSPEQLEMPLRNFSGGEQARVLIARLMLQSADLLLLDEPTNDLDIASLEVLEQSLSDFPGGLVLVTHDRYLLDNVSDRILALDGKGKAEYFSDYNQWETRKKEPTADAEDFAAAEKPAGPRNTDRVRMTSREKKELEGIEEQIHEVEAAIVRVRNDQDNPGRQSDADFLSKCHQEIESLKMKVDSLFARWNELEQKKTQAEPR